MNTRQKLEIYCFGEVLGLIANGSEGRLADAHQGLLSFAGSESNVALALARLGHRVSYGSAVGNDPFGWRILKSLRGEGVDCDLVAVDSEWTTALMLRDRPAWGEPSVFYYRRPSAFGARCAEIAEKVPVGKSVLLFLSGITPALNPQCLQATSDLLHRANAAGTQVWFDINFRSKLWTSGEARAFVQKHLPYMHGVFSSRAEAEIVFPDCNAADLAQRFLDSGVRELVIKEGKDGASYHSLEQKISREVFPIPRELDPIGAGDAFDAGFLSARLDQLSLEEQIERGCALGAIACMNYGDWEGSPTRPELQRFLQGATASLR